MATVDYNLDYAAFSRVLNEKAQELARNGAESAQLKVRANITSKPRVDTGLMRERIGIRQTGTASYDVHSGVFYTLYQEKGVGPFGPVRAKALRFKPKGSKAFVFAKRVRGFPPGNFFRDTLRQMDVSDFIR